MTNSLSTLFAGSTNLQFATQRLPEILSVLLIAGCSYTLATITWNLIPQNNAVSDTPVFISNNKPATRTNATQTFRQLSNAHLFGVVQKNNVTTKAPETKLDLVLKGVLAATPMSIASAIIARKKNGPEDIYGIGDKLPGNVTIKEIHPDHVIISRGGQLETLRLPKDSSSKSFISTSRAQSISSGKQSLKDVRNQIIKDPTSFADYALPIVVKEKGKQVGYRLDFQSKGEVFKKAGLKTTDIITSVNGIKLDTPQKSIRALRKMRTSNALNLIVKRNGADVNISLKLQ